MKYEFQKFRTINTFRITIDGITYAFCNLGGKSSQWQNKRFIPVSSHQKYYDYTTKKWYKEVLVLPYDRLNEKLVITFKDIKLTKNRVMYLDEYTFFKCCKLNRIYEDDKLYLNEIYQYWNG